MRFTLWPRPAIPLGRQSEIDSAAYLRSLGYKVVASGYRTRLGEVDLIAWDGEVLVFVEVKSLRSENPPEDAVGFRKQQKIIRAARDYIARYKLQAASYRFDILAVTARPGSPPAFRLLRDAFRGGK